MRGLQAALLAGDTAFIWSLKKLCEVLTVWLATLALKQQFRRS